MELPLIHFQNWFFGLQFANAVLHPKDGVIIFRVTRQDVNHTAIGTITTRHLPPPPNAG
jgi:hypothetical protein